MSDATPPAGGMDPALDPPAVATVGTERELLQAWLDFHRQDAALEVLRVDPGAAVRGQRAALADESGRAGCGT